MMKNNYKGFLFTLDAIFSLVIASLAVSTLLYVSFVTPVASNSQNDKASSVLNSMLALSTGSVIGNGSISGVYSNPYISYNPNIKMPILTSSSYIRYNKNIPSTSVNAITISIWIYPTGAGSGTGAGNIASALNGSGGMILSSANSYQLARFPNGQLYYSFNTIGLSWIDTNHYIPMNKWSNIVLTYSRASGTLNIYDNSTLISTAGFSGPLTMSSSPCIAAFSVGSNCYANQNFYGSIMNVQIYNVTLNPTDVHYLYSEGLFGLPIGKHNLLGWWPLDGNANDYSGNNQDLTYNNVTFSSINKTAFGNLNLSDSAPILQTMANLYLNGYGGYASEIMYSSANISDYGLFINNKYAPALNIADFNGTNSYINVTGPMNLQNFTISAWVMTTNLKNETIETGNPTGSNHLLEIFYGNSICSNKIPISGYFFVGAYNNVHVCSGLSVTPDKWYNVVTTYNQNSIDIYVNGELNGTYLSSGIPGASSFETIGDCLTCVKYAFDGYIANLQIFNSTLSAKQIAAAYSFGIGSIPISTKRIDGWWPLDGNSNDYTNNYNIGVPTNVIYQNTSFIPIALTNSYLVSRGATSMELHNGNYISIDNISIVVWK